jgi:hypothetical protein
MERTRVSGEHCASDNDVPVNRQRIANATRILGGRQGLYSALLGCLLLSTELGPLWPRGWSHGLVDLVVLAVFVLAYNRWIPEYYEERFGSVQKKEMTAKDLGIPLAVLLGLFFLSLWFSAPRNTTLIRFRVAST